MTGVMIGGSDARRQSSRALLRVRPRPPWRPADEASPRLPEREAQGVILWGRDARRARMVISSASVRRPCRIDESSRSSLRAVPGEKRQSRLSGQALLQGIRIAIAAPSICSGGALRVLAHLVSGPPMTRHAVSCICGAKTWFVLSWRVLPQPAGLSRDCSASDVTQVGQEEATRDVAGIVARPDRESVGRDCPPRGWVLNAERAFEAARLAHAGTRGYWGPHRRPAVTKGRSSNRGLSTSLAAVAPSGRVSSLPLRRSRPASSSPSSARPSRSWSSTIPTGRLL